MSIEQNIENLEIRNANVVTFVGTSSTIVDTISGRIQCKGFQHNSNVITDISGPHGRGAAVLKKYPEIAFEEGKFDKDEGDASSNTYIQAGYVVRASSQVPTSDNEFDSRQVWRLFDGLRANGTIHEGWMARALSYDSNGLPTGTSPTRFTGDQGQWVEIGLPYKIKLQRFSLAPGNNNASLGNAQARFPKVIAIHGYDGSSWTRLQQFTTTQVQSLNETQTFEIATPTGYHEKFVLVVKQTWTADVSSNSSLTNFDDWKLYGYEEDPPTGDHSVDTTIKSRFNNPQLTGVQVFVDGKGSGSNQIAGGPVVTDTVESYDETGKYWNLTGELTSNISVEANTFLEGDQPHAVSVWFNSSNLEANVSNTCVFSISDQEKLDSVNLDLQSNTWHNLTYSYQGEGGSRVTYLDGRKVAEDQAEDTFGDYPPFVMTGYSQGGYVVSASSENSSFPAHRAFENFPQSQNERWQTNRAYTSAGLPHTDSPTTLTYKGEWIQLEQPYKLKINYLKMQAHSQVQHQPENWVILGSNDGTIWEFIKERLDASPFNVDSDGYHINTDVIDSPKFYKYHRIVITKSGATAGTEQPIVVGISLYGHRENDLVRFPDPTNVLKYPHIPFSVGRGGYLDSLGSTVRGEQSFSLRGYTVTSSSNYGNGDADTRSGWNAFDEGNGGTTYSIWQSGDYYTNNTTPGTYTRNPPQRHTAGGVNYDGEWIKLELPHKINVTAIEINSAAYNDVTSHVASRPYEGAILGSNDGSQTGTWDLLKAFSSGLTWTTTTVAEGGGRATLIPDTNTGNAYKYLVLIVNKNEGPRGQFDINEIKYYGTGVDSIPIQIGGGNIDKVANFRVYDRFIEEDQVNEIWNAQKEEFGRAKPQMVLQQGKLGIGTDAPQGSLSVADEPHNLEEFPPRAMTDYKNYFEGHGEFCASASTWYNQASSSSPIYPWNAFNKGALGFSTGNGYANNWEASSADYSSSTGLYTGSINTAGISGDWVQLELPYAIKLDYMELMPMYYNDGTHPNIGPARSPQDGHIMASNDGINWISIYNWTGRTDFKTLEYTRFKVPGTVTKAYKYFRIVWTRTNYTAPSGGSYSAYAAAGELKFFGTREQDQSILHDGQLTLTKSLNVPRIGPALDVDDTPRRDRLVVEYNTSTNPTFEGAVRDTSGRGLDAILRDATYDATDKSFRVGTSQDIILEQGIPGKSGDVTNVSYSIWFKADGVGAANQIIMTQISDYAVGVGLTLALNYNELQLGFGYAYSSGQQIGGAVIDAISAGQWYHVVAIKKGSGTLNATTLPDILEIYINGEKKTLSHGGGTGTLNVGTDHWLIIGAIRKLLSGRTSEEFIGNVSSIKYYDTALTANEVKTLYDMGRCDDGHHVVNFSKTRVGIGLGDGEAPRGALDVRGETPFIGPGLVIHQNASGNWGSTGTPANMNGLVLTMAGESGLTGSSYWNMSVQSTLSSTNLLFSQRGNDTAYISASDNNNQLDFTGQHRTFIKDIPFSRTGELEGLIVSSDQNKYIKLSGGIEAGSNAITINESLPVVSLSTTTNDKKCFGVISASEDPEQRSDAYGSFVTPFEKEKGDTRVYINSVGEGAIWVVNTNGSLESGDYITTSNVAGYGQKQDSEFLANYTVAKITMDCDFEPATQPVQQILRSNVVQTYYLGDVHHVKSVPYEIITTEEGESNVIYDTKYTLTTTANVTESDPWDNVFIDPPEVTYAEYSNLEANVQSTYTLTFTQTTTDEKTPTEWSALESNVQSLYNKVYYQSVEEEVAADYPGAVAHTRVTDQIENTLDEYGQIQWEDHPTETEKAYKVRYLTADGTQTDEANAVHIAAFVGCTYHCG